MRYEKLFEPYRIGTLQLKNRVVMGPVSTRTGDEETNWPSPGTCDYYSRRAQGGVGMIVTEHTCVTQRGIYGRGALRAFPEACIPSWKALFDSIHEYGAKVVAQLQDGGCSAHPKVNGGFQTVSASSTADHYKRHFPDEISIEGIQEYKRDYVAAVGNMLTAGADAVMLHFANGYFLSSFLSERENKRTDRYGGNLENRLRLALEIIDEIRLKYGNCARLFARIGAFEARGGRQIEETKIIVRALERAGVEAISINAGSYYEKDWEIPPYQMDAGYIIKMIADIKKDLTMTVMGGGRVTEPLMADEFLRMGYVDLIEVNRGHIADPDWCNKAQSGRTQSIRRCIGCTRCAVHDFGDIGVDCSVNPYAGKEKLLATTPAKTKKKVLVVGGGPAGLQAAIVAAEKGHSVLLAEKKPYLGGMAKVAAMPPKKGAFVSMITAMAYDAEQLGVEIRLNQEVDVNFVKAVQPDAVILATGGDPIKATFVEGYVDAGFILATDLLMGKGLPGDMPIEKRFLVLGAGSVGLETAEFIATYENDVDVYDMKDSVYDCANINNEAEWQMYKTCLALGVKLHLGCKAVAVEENCLVYEKDGALHKTEPYDAMVCAVGLEPNNTLLEPLKKAGFDPVVIGDALEVSRFFEAMMSAVKAANAID